MVELQATPLHQGDAQLTDGPARPDQPLISASKEALRQHAWAVGDIVRMADPDVANLGKIAELHGPMSTSERSTVIVEWLDTSKTEAPRIDLELVQSCEGAVSANGPLCPLRLICDEMLHFQSILPWCSLKPSFVSRHREWRERASGISTYQEFTEGYRSLIQFLNISEASSQQLECMSPAFYKKMLERSHRQDGGEMFSMWRKHALPELTAWLDADNTEEDLSLVKLRAKNFEQVKLADIVAEFQERLAPSLSAELPARDHSLHSAATASTEPEAAASRPLLSKMRAVEPTPTRKSTRKRKPKAYPDLEYENEYVQDDESDMVEFTPVDYCKLVRSKAVSSPGTQHGAGGGCISEVTEPIACQSRMCGETWTTPGLVPQHTSQLAGRHLEASANSEARAQGRLQNAAPSSAVASVARELMLARNERVDS